MYSDDINLFVSFVKTSTFQVNITKKNEIEQIIKNIESSIEKSIYCPSELKNKLEINLKELKLMIQNL